MAIADVLVSPRDDIANIGIKVFEYMACALPTVTIPRPPLTEIVRDEREGLLFREGDSGGDGEIRCVRDADTNVVDVELFGDFFYLTG